MVRGGPALTPEGIRAAPVGTGDAVTLHSLFVQVFFSMFFVFG